MTWTDGLRPIHTGPPEVLHLTAWEVRGGDHLEEGRRVVLWTHDYEAMMVELTTAICEPALHPLPYPHEDHPHWACREPGVIHRDHHTVTHQPEDPLTVIRGITLER